MFSAHLAAPPQSTTLTIQHTRLLWSGAAFRYISERYGHEPLVRSEVGTKGGRVRPNCGSRRESDRNSYPVSPARPRSLEPRTLLATADDPGDAPTVVASSQTDIHTNSTLQVTGPNTADRGGTQHPVDRRRQEQPEPPRGGLDPQQPGLAPGPTIITEGLSRTTAVKSWTSIGNCRRRVGGTLARSQIRRRPTRSSPSPSPPTRASGSIEAIISTYSDRITSPATPPTSAPWCSTSSTSRTGSLSTVFTNHVVYEWDGCRPGADAGHVRR